MKARLLLVAGLVGGSFMVSPAGGVHAAERVGALNATPSDASFDLSWTKPSDAPGQTGVPSGWEINGYVVRVFNSAFPADGLVKICQHQAGDAQACTVTTDVDGSGSDDLVNGVQYSVSVAARWKDPGADPGNTIDDEDVEGTESALVTVTPRTVPNAPGSPTAAYTDSSEFSDDEVPTITATVSWTTPDNGGATIDQYDALPVDVDGNAIGPDADSSTTSDNETGCTAAGESTLQCDMSGLSLNSTFYFDVSATNDAGASQTARSARLVTPPGPPAITAVTNVAAGVQVTWSAPEGTASITEYTIEALDSTGAVASTTTWTSGTLRSTFTDLTEGEGYTFQVTGQNTSTYDGNALGTGYGVAGTWDQTVTVSGAGGAFIAIEGERVVNSRDDAATPKQGATAGYGTPLRVNVASGDVPSDASAVAVNLTVTNTEEWGFVSAYACSSTSMEEWPGNSNVNFDSAGMTIANSAVVPLTDGHLCLLTYGMTDVIMDVSGYFG